jgi:hypothetical protein
MARPVSRVLNVPGLACEVYYSDLTAARMIAEGNHGSALMFGRREAV